ncbi:MAG: S41 family peptidase [Oscillospiraceae bacterium]|nr:S41 family peptidase [Oscillospiraceae bacterium]
MEKKYSFRFVLALSVIMSALACLVTALVLARSYDVVKKHFGKHFGFIEDYAAILRIVDDMYIGQFDEDAVTTMAMRAAVGSLGDGWSYYLTPDEYASFVDDSNNRFAGIGVNVVSDEQTGGMGVRSVYSNSAAETAGIVAGDVIIAIDGVDITGETVEAMRDRLIRDIGDTVDLTVLHNDGAIDVITVVYDYVFVDPVTFELLDGDIGYIDISNFDLGAADGFISAVDELIARGAVGFIFDVRNNGGGWVEEMTKMLDYLLPEGEIFIVSDNKGNESIIESDSDSIEMPCVVLIDHNSYSAAEYFAATLGEYDYAKIVGEQTSGKNRMQSTYILPGGGALHISTGQYLTKNRVSLYDINGLTPEYTVVLTDEEYELFRSGNLDKGDDPQFSRAVELLTT